MSSYKQNIRIYNTYTYSSKVQQTGLHLINTGVHNYQALLYEYSVKYNVF